MSEEQTKIKQIEPLLQTFYIRLSATSQHGSLPIWNLALSSGMKSEWHKMWDSSCSHFPNMGIHKWYKA